MKLAIDTAVAFAAWLGALLGLTELTYLFQLETVEALYWAAAAVVLVGLVTSLVRAAKQGRLSAIAGTVLVAGCVGAFVYAAFWGTLWVACANGNCL